MIKIENVETVGWEAAIRGMRNPMASHDRSDSSDGCENGLCNGCTFDRAWCGTTPRYIIGENDEGLMKRLASNGPVHAKYRRMITVYADITAPLYLWSEFDTYKVGTVANSYSKMHTIHKRDLTLDDFSNDGLIEQEEAILCAVISEINKCRQLFVETKDKKYWYAMIKLLPNSFNQKRTVMLNYEVLANIYQYRKNHKLDEWREFCKWIETLPYSELITGGADV